MKTRNHSRSWRDVPGHIVGLDTPPGVTTLAALSLAADSMHAAGEMAAHNYYGRLHELLGTPAHRRTAVESSYRDHAEDVWDTLNNWLTAWEGERGVPTAYVVGHWRYVGLPLSQALVRRADRERLITMFAAEGLPPGLRISPADMEADLDSWMPRLPPLFSQTLRALWTNPMARERITSVACLELEAGMEVAYTRAITHQSQPMGGQHASSCDSSGSLERPSNWT